MQVKFGSGNSSKGVKYYYLEVFIDNDYSFRKFLTKEEVYILKKNNLIKD